MGVLCVTVLVRVFADPKNHNHTHAHRHAPLELKDLPPIMNDRHVVVC